MTIEQPHPPEVSQADIDTLLAPERDGTALKPLTLRLRVDHLPEGKKSKLLAVPKVFEFYRDNVVLASRDGNLPSSLTLKERFNSVPAQIKEALLASPLVFEFYRDNIVLADKKDGGELTVSYVADRIKYAQSEIGLNFENDPKVRERFPDIGSRLGS